MKKKLFLLTVALLCTVVQGAWADTWDGETYHQPSKTWLHGLELELCIGIESAAQLAYICEHFNEKITIGDHELKLNEANYLLLTNIDMGTTKSWNSIGNHGDLIPTTYTGSFHGDGHTITIHTSGATANYQGLFARIGNDAMVENLYLAGNIQCSKSRLVGGIAGENYGTIENCWVSADVSSDWQNSSSAYTAKVGGITGENHGTVKYCCVTGNVTNDDKDVGGIVGYNNGGTIDYCTFYGTRYSKSTQDNIWVGDQKGTLTNQHSSDDLLNEDTWRAYLGILVNSYCFVCHKAVEKPYSITIAEGSTALTTDQTKARPGLTITLTPASGTDPKHIVVRNADGNPVAEWYAPIESTLSFTMPQRDVTVIAYDNATWAGKGTEADPYLISTAGEWDQICTQVSQAAGNGAVFSGTYFKQTADFTIKQGIGEGNSKAFGGIYDGDGHTLTCDISVTGEAAAPFHQVSGATISNLHVTGAISGGIHTAGLVAFSSGSSSSRTTIDNCRMSATITCTGNDTNDAHGGGFIGHAGESEYAVTNCLFDGKLIAVTNGKGTPHIGAIVGWGGGGTRIIHTTIEKGTFKGADKSQMAFCWKDNDTYAPSTSGGNYYFSDLGHSDGADKLVSVASGTEGLEITYDYTWEDVYHGAMTKATSGTRYMIDDTFYTTSGSSASFRLTYPAVWNVSKVLANSNEVTSVYDGLYTISNITEATTITVEYSRISWTDKCATEFTTVDEEKKVVTITTPEELARLAKLVYSGENSGNGWTYNLAADLDMSTYDWTPIGKGMTNRFRGTFDGQGHTISGITIPDPDKSYVGLFGVVNGTVKNLKLVNSTIEGKRYVGSIAAEVRGTLENCYVGSDVTVTAVAVAGESETGNDCGGVVGSVQNQGAKDGFDATSAVVRGCYSAARVIGVSHVGGIVGNLFSGTVHYCVSEANVSATGTDGSVAYIVGNNGGGTNENNFYYAETASSNSTDTRAYHIALDEKLAKVGFSMQWGTENSTVIYNASGLTFMKHVYDDGTIYDYVDDFMIGDEWYGPDNEYFYFHLPSLGYIESGNPGCELTDVKVNGKTPNKDSHYYFKVSEDAVVTATAKLIIYDGNNNKDILEACHGLTANVEYRNRTLFKDGNWNTLCLPFDLTISGSPLDGADVRTLVSSSFDSEKGELTLNFTKKQSEIKAGMPYIIRWEEPDEVDIVAPTFTGVTIDNTIVPVGTADEPARFEGFYTTVGFFETDKTTLYMGADNKLYYPKVESDHMEIRPFRACFFLQNGLTAGDLPKHARAFVLNFGDDEATGIISVHDSGFMVNGSDAWYTLDGRRLYGKPTQRGIYINNGRKVVIK